MSKFKNLTNKIILILVIINLVLLFKTISLSIERKNNIIENNKIKKVYIEKDFIRKDNKREIDLNDGSFAIFDDYKKEYTFQCFYMGDWENTFKDSDSLNKCIENYITINN